MEGRMVTQFVKSRYSDEINLEIHDPGTKSAA